MHVWAADPKTAGALAATRLATYASKAELSETSRLKDDIRQAGAIPVLVDWLKSDEVDRLQWALIALSILTGDNKENIAVVYQAGALELLLKVACSEVAGERAAASTILRNIGLEDAACRQKFVKLGGIRTFVNQLDAPPDPALDRAAVQLEAVLNLQDMLETEDGDTIPEYAKLAFEAGALEKLKPLMTADDEEVRSSAKEVYDHIAQSTKTAVGSE